MIWAAGIRGDNGGSRAIGRCFFALRAGPERIGFLGGKHILTADLPVGLENAQEVSGNRRRVDEQ